MIGIRENLKDDTASLKYSIDFMNGPIAYYDSALKQVAENKINAAYVNGNSGQLINDMHFTSDNGLFESFKSSGNLRLIKNQKLLTEITSLYTSDLPFLQNNEEQVFLSRERDYSEYIGSKYGVDSFWNTSISSHLNEPSTLFHFQKYDIFLKAMKKHREDMITRITRILTGLNKELEENFGVKPDTK